MGAFRIEIEAVGGHGADRHVKDGGKLDFDGYDATHVDRVAHEAVEALRARGASVSEARIIHWPDTTGQVVDDVLAKRRHGSFPS